MTGRRAQEPGFYGETGEANWRIIKNKSKRGRCRYGENGSMEMGRSVVESAAMAKRVGKEDRWV